MKIKTRIFASNTVMVLFVLAVMLAVTGIMINAFEPRYNEVSRRVMGEDVFRVENILKSHADADMDFAALEQQLTEYHYHLVVTQGDEMLYSGVDEDRLKWIMEWINTADHAKGDRGMMLMDNATLIRVHKVNDEVPYTIMAVLNSDQMKPERHFESPFVRFQRSFVIICLAAIAVLLLLSQVFTRMLSKRIMKPMEQLVLGARRIENGDYSVPIMYSGEKEFEAVCDAFNQMQQALQLEREKNAAYEKARTDMVASISHDLRTPLTSIKGYIKGLRDGVASTPEKQEKYLQIAYNKAGDMDKLLSRLLYFSKMETGNLPLFTHRAELGGVIAGYAEEANKELAVKGAALEVCIEDECIADVDVEQIKRVFTNLVDNAMKYAKADKLEMRLLLKREGDMAVMTFSDNGDGVEEAQLPLLFDQFYRADAARGAQMGNGSGLGLYIVKYIIKAHGGQVAAYNAQGLSIKMALPIAKEG